MKSGLPRTFPQSSFKMFVSGLMAMVLFAAPLMAQRRDPAPGRPAATPNPTFDTLLGADSYEMYGEVRNVGQLLSSGGAGEIVDPIMKLAEPPKEFLSIVKFLKTNSEPLATARLMFAAWPARNDIPATFVAIEFDNPEEAAKFAPKLDTFLPTILPPVPVKEEENPSAPGQVTAGDPGKPSLVISDKNPTASAVPSPVAATPTASPQKPEERLPFVISHRGNLVFISDKAFKFEKLHPASAKPLAEDQNFRIARDRFSSEPIFLFFNVALGERVRPKAAPKDVVSDAEADQKRREEEARIDEEAERERAAAEAAVTPTPIVNENQNDQRRGVLIAGPEPSPTPTPTKEQQAQAIATSQMGSMLDFLGLGEPQWPEAVGVALVLDNNEYVVRALLVESQSAKKLPLPFVPQLISGSPYAAEATSVLPDDTEIFVSVSIDMAQTYAGMRKQAEQKTKAEARQIGFKAGEEPLDPFAAFEKKAGFKISEDLLPAFGNEIAVAASLSSLGAVGGAPFAFPSARAAKPENKDEEKDQNKKLPTLPMLLIAVKDREAARKVLPRVLDGLGMGEANMIASVQKHEDTELVDYGGFFAYAFVGNFVVLSDTASVKKSIDAYLNHHTLSSNSAFRNASRWQPKQILGNIYVSPVLMEAYHEEVRKQAPTMDPAMRDFLMRLTPTSEAISYALSNDGLGALHELHLPKNLIITMVAGISSMTKNLPPETNEMIAISSLQMLNSAETSYKATTGKGSFGTIDQLIEQKLLTKDVFDKYGYKIEVRVSGDQFEAVTTPVEYGKSGKRSFFVDQSGVIRGDDHGGGAATIADKPVEP